MVAHAGTVSGGESAGVSGAGGSVAGDHRRPTCFPGLCSRSCTSWCGSRSERGRNSGRRRVRLNHRCGGDGGQVLAPALPNLVALVCEGGQILEILHVYHVADVGGHPAEEQDLLHLHYGGWLQGVELVHENRRFVRALTEVIQPFDNLLVFAEAVRAQNNALKLLARVFH